RGLSADADLRAAGDAGYACVSAGGEEGAAGAGLRERGREAEAGDHSAGVAGEAVAGAGGRAAFDGGGLGAVLPNVLESRRAGRGAHPFAGDGRADDAEPYGRADGGVRSGDGL